MLGAGGVLGGAWLTGGLSALARETDWDPGSAEFIVGTSAGSMIGALVAARRAALVHGRPLARRDLRRARRPGRPARGRGRPRRGRRLPAASRPAAASGPARCAWLFTALSNPLRHTPLQMVAGWLPSGFISTDSLKDDREPRRARLAGSSTRTTGPSRATTSPGAACRSAASAPRAPRSATPWRRRARSPASTGR